MIGFETIGNAILICHDGEPVLVTDPWLSDSAYFGSWGCSHQVPPEQRESISRCDYVWISHGHPDHLDPDAIESLSDKTFLLPDHVGGRIHKDLSALGLNVRVLPDREWVELSDHIRVNCVTDYNQDSILLVDLNGSLIVNINDAGPRGWERVVRKAVAERDRSFLLKTFGYGDADMINYWDEDGQFVVPPASRKDPVGEQMAAWCRRTGVTDVIPFSSFHVYRRTDSAWAAEYTTPVSAYSVGFDSRTATLHEPFMRVDLERGHMEPLRPAAASSILRSPEECGDSWAQPLDQEDVEAVRRYLMRIQSLEDRIDFVTVSVGGHEHVIDFSGPKTSRGLTFEVPRASLMSAIEHNVFDDLLIANFMKTTLHGRWSGSRLNEHFTPYVAKYADNAGVYRHEEIRRYMATYRMRDPIAFILHRLEHSSKAAFRSFLRPDSVIFRVSRAAYRKVR